MDNLTLYGTLCGTCGKQAHSYSFVVDAVGKIDLNRIVREQYEAGNLVTLLTDGKEPKGLLIHNEFLEKYDKEYAQEVNSEDLSPYWGWSALGVQYDSCTFSLIQSEAKYHIYQLKESRFRPISDANIEKTKTELAAARAFTRKIKVVVHSL